MTQYRVLISGNSDLWCHSLMLAFEENFAFEVVASVKVEEIIERCLSTQPDVLLLKLDDLSLLNEIMVLKDHCPFTLPVMMLEDPNTLDVSKLLHNGVRGCLPTRLFPRQIVNAVELIAAAGIICIPRMGNGSHSHGNYFDNEVINRLTIREREILLLLCKSLSNQEMASSLCISEATVKTHLRNIFKKLEVRNRSQALAMIMQTDTAIKTYF